MRPQIVPILTVVLSFLVSASMLAQSSGPPPPAQRRPPEAPIDTQLVYLLVLGVFLGCYFLYKKTKQRA